MNLVVPTFSLTTQFAEAAHSIVFQHYQELYPFLSEHAMTQLPTHLYESVCVQFSSHEVLTRFPNPILTRTNCINNSLYSPGLQYNLARWTRLGHGPITIAQNSCHEKSSPISSFANYSPLCMSRIKWHSLCHCIVCRNDYSILANCYTTQFIISIFPSLLGYLNS